MTRHGSQLESLKFMDVKFIAIAFAFVALAGCGGGDDESSPPPPPQPSADLTPSTLPIVVGGKGTVELLAGSFAGVCGTQDGSGEQAQLGEAGAITIHQGKVLLADAGCGQTVPSRIRSIDVVNGTTTTFYAPKALLTSPAYPTGIVVDSNENVFVVDGINLITRRGTSIAPPIQIGKGSGIWKATPTGMKIFAGVEKVNRVDGVGLDAGFIRLNGLAIDSEDNLFTNDFGKLRKITQKAEVSTLDFSYSLTTPFIFYSGEIYGYRNGGNSLTGIESGNSLGEVRVPYTNIFLVDKSGNAYSAPLQNDPSTFYRRAAGATTFEPILENVMNLHSAALDDEGRLYIKQGNTIIKVTLN